MAPRLVRRRPLAERIQAYLDPLDFLMWLSEGLDSSQWDQWQKEWANPIGLVLNVAFVIARANSGPSNRSRGDDVFGEVVDHTSWLAWFVCMASVTKATLRVLTQVYLGSLHRSPTIAPVLRQCDIYLLPPAPLQAL